MKYKKLIQEYIEAFTQMKDIHQRIKNLSELTTGELSLIIAIGKNITNAQGIKSVELSKLLKVTPAAISKMLTILENKKLIERSNDAKDRRAVYIQLTHLGNDIFLQALGEEEELLEQVFKNMGEKDSNTFIQLMNEFNQTLLGEYEQAARVSKFPKNPRNTIFIEDMNFSFTPEDILLKIGMPSGHILGDNIQTLSKIAAEISKPKAFFMEMEVEKCIDKSITFGGQTFFSTSLAKKIKKGDIVYPYLCTCGRELADYAKGIDDVLEQYIFDVIMETYQEEIAKELLRLLYNRLPENETIFSVAPGSWADWSIYEQKKLFAIFGDNAKRAGVLLTSGSLMYPVKSISGVYCVVHAASNI